MKTRKNKKSRKSAKRRTAKANPVKRGRASKKRAYKRNPAVAAASPAKKSRRSRRSKKSGKRSVSIVGRPARSWKSTKTAKRAVKARGWKVASTSVRRTWRKGNKIHKETTLFLPNPLAGTMGQLVTLGLATAFGAVVSQNIDGMVAVRGTDKHPEAFTGIEGATLVAAKPDAPRLLAQAALFGVAAVGSGFAKKKGYNMVAAGLGGIALGTLVNNVLDLFHKLAVPALPDSMRGAYPNMTQANQDNLDKSAEALRSGAVAAPAASTTAGVRRSLAGTPTGPAPRMIRTPVALPSGAATVENAAAAAAKSNPFTPVPAN